MWFNTPKRHGRQILKWRIYLTFAENFMVSKVCPHVLFHLCLLPAPWKDGDLDPSLKMRKSKSWQLILCTQVSIGNKGRHRIQYLGPDSWPVAKSHSSPSSHCKPGLINCRKWTTAKMSWYRHMSNHRHTIADYSSAIIFNWLTLILAVLNRHCCM